MSVRSELRVAALERDAWMCRWPECDISGSENLEMAHLIQSSAGGVDELENVVMLCRAIHHPVLDNRGVVKFRRQEIMRLLRAYVREHQW